MDEIEQKMNEQTERDIPRILEVGEAIRKAKALEAAKATSPLAEQVDIEQQTQIVLYQQKVEELEKQISKLRDEIRNVDYVLKDAIAMRDITRTEHTELNESCLFIVQVLSDMKGRLVRSNESKHAQLEGYSEFIQKLGNGEQLEFNL